ncbi:hypothetical protein [Brevundimonas lutea]|uniref:hypothetical protein n=1 Tax=Brevundimonas lutea TaxID=2293980 RepID=UPI0013CE786C|nr:hypothetical protein [Brevundimonas lutea]
MTIIRRHRAILAAVLLAAGVGAGSSAAQTGPRDCARECFELCQLIYAPDREAVFACANACFEENCSA